MQPQAGDATPKPEDDDSPQPILTDMNDRTREVFRRVVEGYLTSGEPVGSRTLTRTLSEKVSAATVRNVMQDLEYLGLLDSPHVSAGRVPTQAGLRMFVDSLLEVGQVAPEDQEKIDATLGVNDQDVASLLDEVGAALSVITRGASVVLSPKREAAIRHIEFVSLAADRALVVLVFADGQVENRVFVPPPGQTPSSMREAANFLNALAEGRTLSELRARMVSEIASRRQEIDSLARQLVESGLALWENAGRVIGAADRARAVEPDRRSGGSGRDRPHPGAVRRPGTQARHRRIPEPDRGGRRGAHFYRIGEQAFLTFRFKSGGFSLYER
jgi:heat-inducible transcriptional repressor